MHNSVILAQPAPVRDWQPDFPGGTLRAVILHWTAGDYTTVFPAYHYCLSGAAEVVVHATRDLRANMCDVQSLVEGQYAAHTQGRNSFAAGIAACAMQSATPHDFGEYALTSSQVDALCVVAAALVRRYGLAVTDIRTHAEAAVEDGYFGAGCDDVRWDIARLQPAVGSVHPSEAVACGNFLRQRIAQHL